MIYYGVLSKTFYILAGLTVCMLILALVLSIAISVMEKRIKQMGFDLDELEAKRMDGGKK